MAWISTQHSHFTFHFACRWSNHWGAEFRSSACWLRLKVKGYYRFVDAGCQDWYACSLKFDWWLFSRSFSNFSFSSYRFLVTSKSCFIFFSSSARALSSFSYDCFWLLSFSCSKLFRKSQCGFSLNARVLQLSIQVTFTLSGSWARSDRLQRWNALTLSLRSRTSALRWTAVRNLQQVNASSLKKTLTSILLS